MKPGIFVFGIKRNSKIFILSFVFLISCAAIILAVIHFNKSGYDKTTVLRINGEAVTVREFKQYMIDNSSKSFSYFSNKYGIRDSADFWTNNYGGEVPISHLKEISLKELKRTKIQQILAKQKGILSDISYSTFLKSLSDENNRRNTALKKKGIIYGLTQYGEAEYYSYVMANLALKLKEKLGEDELAVSDNELYEYYMSVRDTIYKQEDTIKVKEVMLEYRDNKERETDNNGEQAKYKIGQIRNHLAKGGSLENLTSVFPEDSDAFKLKIVEITFSSESARAISEDEEKLFIKSEAEKLSEGQVSGVFETNRGFGFITCTGRIPGEYAKYDEIKDTVKMNYLDLKYESYIDELAKNAEAEIVEKVYDKLSIR